MTSTQEQLYTYRKFGYVVVLDTLSVEEVDAINAAIDRDLAAETPFWIEREDGHVILNAHALLAYKEMDVTMRPPTLMPLLEGILGSHLRAEEHTVHIRKPYAGKPYCHWHRDGNGWPELGSPPAFASHYVSVAFYLSDVDESTHTFSVLPGSAVGDELAPLAHYELDAAHHIEGPRGTAVVFNAGMFHGGNVRRSDVERRTVHIYCGRASSPPISNHTIVPKRLWAHPDAATRAYYSKPNAITRLLQERF